MQIRVGTKEGDVVGSTNRALQLAADALSASGGGTLEIGPGTYVMDDALRLTSNVRVVGSGNDCVLKKCDGPVSPLVVDADYGQLKATVEDASRFRIGMGIYVNDDRYGGWHASTARITGVEGNTIHFDERLVSDYSSDRNGFVANACSIVRAVDAENVGLENLVIDGNAGNNHVINGCRAGGVYLHVVTRARVTGCTVRDFNGDGMSWQITRDVTVEDCVVERSANIGVHPGTGSANTVIRGCGMRANAADGLFLCWRVQDSVIEDCTIVDNGRHGISLGHKDTDNLVRGNTIARNARCGVFFRDEKVSNAGNNNRFEANTIEGNGTAVPSAAVEIRGETSGIVFASNTIRPGDGGDQRVAFAVGPKAADPELHDNEIAGHVDGVMVRVED